MASTTELASESSAWTEEQRLKVQRKAQVLLQEWQDKIQSLRSKQQPKAAVSADGDVDGDDDEDVFYFRHMGFLRVAGFSDESEVTQMKQEMSRLVQTEWDPHATTSEHRFATDDRANEERGDYFLDSADRVHFFVEPAALDPITGTLLPQYHHHHHGQAIDSTKMSALNKVGHGLHLKHDTVFHTYATSTKLQDLVHRRLGWMDPVIPQSMYIFKQARIGGAVHSHQDSTFLYTTPRQTCLGCWLALDDATLENGCLWVRPESHYEPVRRKFVRNPAYYFGDGGDTGENDDVLERGQSHPPQGDLSLPKLVMTSLTNDPDKSSSRIPWDGSLPEPWQPSAMCSGLFDAGFIPIECKAGDLVVFHGTLDHLSLPNESNAPRHTFQLHLVEGPNAGITWSKSNWLQYPDGVSFMNIAKQQQL